MVQACTTIGRSSRDEPAAHRRSRTPSPPSWGIESVFGQVLPDEKATLRLGLRCAQTRIRETTMHGGVLKPAVRMLGIPRQPEKR